MKNKLLITSTIALSILMTLPASAGTPKGKPFVEIQGELVEVKESISLLESDISSLYEAVNTLEGRVSANEQAIVLLQEEDVRLNGVLAALEVEAGTLSAQIEAFDSALLEVDETMQAEFDRMNALLGLNRDNINNQLILINQNALAIEELQQENEMINAELAKKQDTVTGYCPDGSSIRQILADGGVICEYDDGLSPILVVAGQVTLQGDTYTASYEHRHCEWYGCWYHTHYYTVYRTPAVGTAVADCDRVGSGYKVIGGGYATPHHEVQILSGITNHGGNDYRVKFRNGYANTLTLTAYASCAQQ